MKHLIVIALSLCVLLLPLEARRRWIPRMAAAASYLLSDNLEYANNTAMTTGGWTLSGGTAGYNTAPAPLQGSFSFKTASASDSATKGFTAQTTVWAYCLFNTATLNDQYAFRLLNGSSVQVAAVRFLADGRVRAYSGTTDFGDSSSGFVSSATTYSIWLSYTTNGTSASTVNVYVSTTTTKPAITATASGNETTSAAIFEMLPSSADIAIWDYVRVSATTIGSAPL